MLIYSTCCDIGDVIYSLPVLAAMGGGRLVLYPHLAAREPWYPAKVENVRELLENQWYISQVQYRDSRDGVVLDYWRQEYNNDGTSLMETICATFGVSWPQDKGWLVAEPLAVAPVVIARSERYHGVFDWRKVMAKYKDAVFVGHPAEHARFQLQFGKVPFYATRTLWELARVIAGAKVFVANQSAPMSVAMGLNSTKIVQEVSLVCANCLFSRPTAFYGDGCLPDDA